LFHCLKVYKLSKLAKNAIIDSDKVQLSLSKVDFSFF